MLKKLSKGATICLINPAFKNNSDVFSAYQKMFDWFTNNGFKLKYGKTFTQENGYLAGSDEDRVKDIEDAFLDKEVDCIICMRGGYGCSRIVDKINYEIIKNNPKIFCGFSDITVLLNAIYQKTNIITIHGLVSLFLGKIDEFSENDFLDILTKNTLGKVLENPLKDALVLNEGKATGVLVGGNLSLLATLTGTDFEVDFTDKIVFIEEVEEEPYQIDRYLSALRLSKSLQKAKGFVLGYFTDCNPSKSRINTQSVNDIINDYFKKIDVPVLYNFACGHSFPFVNLPIGIKVELDCFNKKITILEEMYEEY